MARWRPSGERLKVSTVVFSGGATVKRMGTGLGGGAWGPFRGSGRQQRSVGLLGQDRGQRVRNRLAPEGLLAREHLVEHGAESEDVAALVHGLAAGLLGAHVRGGAKQDGAAGEGGGGQGWRLGGVGGGGIVGEGFGKAEVEHLDLALGGDLDVRRLQVAVDDAALVGLFEGVDELTQDGGDFVRG